MPGTPPSSYYGVVTRISGTLRQNHAGTAIMLIERIWAAKQLPQFPLPDRVPRDRRGACSRSARVAALPGHRLGQGAGRITQILNTHEHLDHTGGNAGLVCADRCPGPWLMRVRLPASAVVDRGLQKGDVIRVGRTVELECLDTPGHTMSHVCLFAQTGQPALFLR